MIDDLSRIRQQKLNEMQNQQSSQLQEKLVAQQQLESLENIVKSKLSKEALERYGNIRAANPEQAVQILGVIHQIVTSRNIEIITDDQFKELIRSIIPKKKEFKIVRR